MNEFIKVGNKVDIRPQGLDYALEAGRCYNLEFDEYESYTYLTCDGELSLPDKIYGSDEIKDRIIKSYNNSSKSMGVLLEGLKGSGKTLFAKQLAKASNLPIIIVKDSYPIWKACEAFAKFSQPVVILLDEIEKNDMRWPTSKLLKLLDGIQDGAKKLTIMTCNDSSYLDDNLMNRCGRIRYHLMYERLSEEVVKNIIDTSVGDNINKDELFDFITTKIDVLSYDNVITICDEVNLFPELSFDEIVRVLNITKKDED